MKRLLATSALIVLGATLYQRFLRAPIMTWGASDTEAAARLPGDELIETPAGVSTRAISIDAPPEAVWPWLAQIGPAPRGGIYTYDWIENLLGLNMHSANEILEEFQQPEAGDTIGFGPNKMVLEIVEPNSHAVWRSEDGNWVWSFVLMPTESGGTRMLSRNSFRLPRVIDRIGMIPMEPGSLVMERKMLLGFKERAERLNPRYRR